MIAIDNLKEILMINGVDYEEGDWTQPGDTLIDLRVEAIKLVKMQIETQGCPEDSLREVELMQPNIFQWISFFNITEEELEAKD